jgi:hypothetical protein
MQAISMIEKENLRLAQAALRNSASLASFSDAA